MPPLQAADAHRADIADLVSYAQNDLALIMADYTDPIAARDALTIALPELVSIYGSAAATLGADWYAELRDLAEVPGRFTPVTATLPDVGRTDALARWGVDPLFGSEPDAAAAYERVSGGLQRIVANADRDTITASATTDLRCRGWIRRSSPGTCDYCRDLTGILFWDRTADFKCHDHCRCIAVPDFG